jgi:hypothetical protein
MQLCHLDLYRARKDVCSHGGLQRRDYTAVDALAACAGFTVEWDKQTRGRYWGYCAEVDAAYADDELYLEVMSPCKPTALPQPQPHNKWAAAFDAEADGDWEAQQEPWHAASSRQQHHHGPLPGQQHLHKPFADKNHPHGPLPGQHHDHDPVDGQHQLREALPDPLPEPLPEDLMTQWPAPGFAAIPEYVPHMGRPDRFAGVTGAIFSYYPQH